ncbi:hypothetical protein DPMN_035130 [Dreissena polymorpha]|uniref:Uncharacterized protein n=1 Tax=Dreissena polymorpha TaxID=45954 RepID=A0A9D4M8Y3_DREPO|nr:hypothetical protein DPMN_035130 [Dreissena polymorpha]
MASCAFRRVVCDSKERQLCVEIAKRDSHKGINSDDSRRVYEVNTGQTPGGNKWVGYQ